MQLMLLNMSKCQLNLTYDYIYPSSGARNLLLPFDIHTKGVKQMNHMSRRVNCSNFHNINK